MKINKIPIISIIVISLLSLNTSSSMILNSTQLLVWSEDFEGNSLDEWAIRGISYYTDPVSFGEGSFSIADGGLVATSSNNSFNIIEHISDAAYGNWSFDFYLANEYSSVSSTYVDFIGYNWTDAEVQAEGYTLEIHPNSIGGTAGYRLWKNNAGHPLTAGTYSKLDEKASSVPVDTILHFDISRGQDGTFQVMLNASPILQGQNSNFIESSYFRILMPIGPKIDNIVVNGVDKAPYSSSTSSSSKDRSDDNSLPFVNLWISMSVIMVLSKAKLRKV